MITGDFYGLNGFVWWVGIVEDINDPLQLGSVRARIIGIHSEQKNLVPTESLPWAQVALPTSGAMTTSGPRVGDWVFGFFQDGSYAQIPVVMGIFPGIQSSQSQIVYNEYARKTSVPIPPTDIVVRRLNEPTTSRTSRGVQEGTHASRSNKRLAKACDISYAARAKMGQLAVQFGTILRQIRTYIRALIAKYGGQPSPIWRKIKDTIDKLTSALREIKDFYEEEIKPLMETVVAVAQFIRILIDYIASLPERLAQLIAACLREFIETVAAQLVGDASGPENPFTQIIEAAEEFVEAAEEVAEIGAEIAAFPADVVDALVNPSSDEDLENATVELDAFFAANIPTPEQSVSNNSYNASASP
jgi:hypothetical protein